MIENPNAAAEPPTDDELISALFRGTPGAVDAFCIQSWGEWERKDDGLLRWEQFWDPGHSGVEVEMHKMKIGGCATGGHGTAAARAVLPPGEPLAGGPSTVGSPHLHPTPPAPQSCEGRRGR